MHTHSSIHLPLAGLKHDSNQPLLQYLPIVRRIALSIHKRLPSWVEFDDLLSAGMLGLIEASANFNSSKNPSFGGFAQFRVRGAILDSLRRSDWAPRKLRHQGRLVQEAFRCLSSRLSRTPSDDEVATELKMSLNDYQKLINDLAGLEIGSLDHAQAGDSEVEEAVSVPTRSEDDPLFQYLEGERRTKVAQAIENLSEQERLVTTLFYYEELTQEEIGLALGLSATKIKHIRASALRHLRAAIGPSSTIHNEGPMLVPGNRRAIRHHAILQNLAA